MVEKKRSLTKEDGKFLAALAVFALFYMLRYFEHVISQYNTTLFALSYKYGFISRGMVGTIWLGLDALLPINLMTYEAVYWFTVVMTLVYFLMFFAFYKVVLERIEESKVRNIRYMIVFLSIFVFPEFLGDEMFGRLDLYLFILTMICVILLVKEKGEWWILPICLFCVCIHQGFVFTNINILLVLLFYKIMTCEGKKQKKYIGIFVTTLIGVSVLFLYFELFSHSQGTEIYKEIVTLAKSLSEDGKSYNESIINHEILGKDVFEDEILMHQDNYHEFPVALLLWSPYILMGCGFLWKMIHGEKGKAFWAYLAVIAGGITIVPEMILKVDYGRYFFLLFFYYILAIMCLYVLGDKKVGCLILDLKSWLKDNIPVPYVVLAYPMFLMPFFDVLISPAVYKMSVWFFGEVL